LFHERPERFGALCGREHAAGALRVERMAEPVRGAVLEILRLRIVIGKYVRRGWLGTRYEYS